MTFDSSGIPKPYGTGLMLDISSKSPFVCLVTNRHLVIGKDSLIIRVNGYSENESYKYYGSADLLIYPHGYPSYIPKSDDSDFALILLKRSTISDDFRSIAIDSSIDFASLNYGDEVEFYGFPNYQLYGLFDQQYMFPILRKGSIAYFAENRITLPSGKTAMIPKMFMIDGVSIGGNSGGPIFVKKESVKLDSNGAHSIVYKSMLAGIICGHLPTINEMELDFGNASILIDSMDVQAVLPDSSIFGRLKGKYKIGYKENSNLALAISIDIIKEYFISCLLGATKK